MVLFRGLPSSRRNTCVWFCCALLSLICSTHKVPAKGNSDTPFSSAPKRYLFVVENSREMQPRAKAVFDTLKSLLDSTTKTQLRPGDTLGIWTFNDTLNPGCFPLQEWSPELKLPLAIRVASFLQAESYDKHGDIEKALAQMNQVIHASPDITVILITSGQGEIRGSAFDQELNAKQKQYADQQEKIKMPMVTALRGSDGQITAWAVHAAPLAAEVALFPAVEQKSEKIESDPASNKALQFSTTPLPSLPKEKKADTPATPPAPPAAVAPAKTVAVKTEPAPVVPAPSPKVEQKIAAVIPPTSAPLKPTVEAKPIPAPTAPTPAPPVAQQKASTKPQPLPAEKKELVQSEPKKNAEAPPAPVSPPPPKKAEPQPAVINPAEKLVAAAEPKAETPKPAAEPKNQTAKPAIAPPSKPPAEVVSAAQTAPAPASTPEPTSTRELTVSARELAKPQNEAPPQPTFAVATPAHQNWLVQNGIWILILLLAGTGAALCLIMWVRSFSRPQIELTTLPESPTGPSVATLSGPSELLGDPEPTDPEQRFAAGELSAGNR